MGKKNKKKKQRKRERRRKLYNKKEFAGIFCSKCNLCKGGPSFCYQYVYRTTPHLFLKPIFDRLLETDTWNKSRTNKNVIDVGEFRYIFCLALEGTCGAGMNCDYMTSCYNAFQNQLHGAPPSEVVRKRKRKARAKKKKYIAEPYPTVFMSDNDEFINFVKGLFDDNTDFEQDSAEEPSNGVAREAHRLP
jgi:hypothetical protein